MTKLGVIGGSGAELTLLGEREVAFDTPYGPFEAIEGALSAAPGRGVVFVRRHGAGHAMLSSSVRHRTNLWGLRECGVSGVIATTVCGIIDPRIALARPIVFDDMFFPDNRLPEGGPCTFFDEPGRPGRGHLIAAGPFSPSMRAAAVRAAGGDAIDGGTYAYALGPRFNTASEIVHFRAVGVCAVSQTAGPEAVLAGELELPYCLVGYGTDYANGVMPQPTPIEVLEQHMAGSAAAFEPIISGVVAQWDADSGFDTGFVYRFE